MIFAKKVSDNTICHHLTRSGLLTSASVQNNAGLQERNKLIREADKNKSQYNVLRDVKQDFENSGLNPIENPRRSLLLINGGDVKEWVYDPVLKKMKRAVTNKSNGKRR